MGQLFSTVNRSRANSVINAPRTQSSQARSPPTPQPKSDTTIIIPLNGKQLQETALEKQQSTESNQEPIMNHLGKIYNDELPAFDVSDSNEDLEETSNISDSLDQVQEKSEEPVTLEQRGSEQVGKMPVKPVSLDHRGATLNQLENGPQITSNVENMDKNSLPPNPRETTLEDTSNVHDGVKSKTDLVTDIPDHYPFVGSKSVFDAVIDLATDGLPRKSTVAIINNICAPHDKVPKHTILSKNSVLGRVASDAPEPGDDDDDETARELVEGIIVDTIQSGNYIPENQF